MIPLNPYVLVILIAVGAATVYAPPAGRAVKKAGQAIVHVLKRVVGAGEDRPHDQPTDAAAPEEKQ